MHKHPTVFADLFSWILPLVMVALLGAYLTGVILLKRAGKKWNNLRTICFIVGIILVMIALTPPLSTYGHLDLRVHMIQHLMIGMLAPLGLVLAAPVSLAFRVLPPGKSRKITSLLGSRTFHLLSHPVTALVLNIGGMFLLYLTPLYKAMQNHLWIHYAVHIHFLGAGSLFIWSIAGPDPAPKRPSLPLRLLVLFISMALHSWLSKLMYAHEFPKSTTHSTEEIMEAAKLMYYGGDLAEILLAIAFFTQWYRAKSHQRVLLWE